MKASSPILFIAASLVATGIVSADVYKSVDENGNVSFGETAVDGAEKVVIPEPNLSQSSLQLTEQPEGFDEQPATEPETVTYKSLEIVSPDSDQITEGRTGTVNVTFLSTPSLAPEDQLVITVNGEDVSKGSDTSLTLEQLDRGAHSVTGRILNSESKIKIQSDVVTFHVQRPSVLNKPSLALDGNN